MNDSQDPVFQVFKNFFDHLQIKLWSKLQTIFILHFEEFQLSMNVVEVPMTETKTNNNHKPHLWFDWDLLQSQRSHFCLFLNTTPTKISLKKLKLLSLFLNYFPGKSFSPWMRQPQQAFQHFPSYFIVDDPVHVLMKEQNQHLSDRNFSQCSPAKSSHETLNDVNLDKSSDLHPCNVPKNYSIQKIKNSTYRHFPQNSQNTKIKVLQPFKNFPQPM